MPHDKTIFSLTHTKKNDWPKLWRTNMLAHENILIVGPNLQRLRLTLNTSKTTTTTAIRNVTRSYKLIQKSLETKHIDNRQHSVHYMSHLTYKNI